MYSSTIIKTYDLPSNTYSSTIEAGHGKQQLGSRQLSVAQCEPTQQGPNCDEVQHRLPAQFGHGSVPCLHVVHGPGAGFGVGVWPHTDSHTDSVTPLLAGTHLLDTQW